MTALRSGLKTTLPSVIAVDRRSLASGEVFPDAAPMTSAWLPAGDKSSRKRFASIYHHVFEPKMPPSNFLGVTHDKTPQTTTKLAGDIKVPGDTRNVRL